MPQLNRRTFLRASAGVGALGLLSGAAAVSWPELMDAAHRRPLAQGDGIAVIVTLYGGNDGINTLIPYSDNAYHDARPDLAYAPGDVLHLDDQLGLNPALKGLHAAWGDGNLAIVRGVSYPKPDHSHFRSMDIWQTASPDEPTSTGWIGRWLDSTGDDPLRAVNVGAVLPPMAVGEKATAAALSTTTTAASAGRFAATIAALSAPDGRDTDVMSAVAASYRTTQDADKALAHLGQSDAGRKGNPLAAQLDVVAKAITSGVPSRVYMVSLGGFDTHADERGRQQRLLQTFDEAVTAFLHTMAADPHGKDVVVLAYSEFGRRVHANASQGTDHGTAGPVFVAGLPVRGGFHGDEPSLTDLDDGDLKTTTDFRDVYYDVLTHTLGADPTPVVGPGRRGLGLL
ncbi:hypothetical protein MMAD_24010 [Mycolicibacterium madagascariense]|uniref:DUF1501 domain-containing protein n=1 Tax=Mycolicibacterium madagascariense TaxID=212765 RepID=A0A7I7XG05_9MYCO|nr:DUF1501 domain-containing protein [Mycolicibacterium madagascariense]MCV7013856.1 DUF1501 domain-containing protein [Mycolicibacterium madagascariense]BBZ28106.1 hypothetical protein MMAD_24010 [Mycolicibacterium madagascariense]